MGLFPRSCSSLLSGAGAQGPWAFTHLVWGKAQGGQTCSSATKVMICFTLLQRSSFAMKKKKAVFCRDWPLSRCLGPFLELALKIEQDVQKPSPECAKWLKASGEDKGSVGRTEARKPTPFLCQMREAFCP